MGNKSLLTAYAYFIAEYFHLPRPRGNDAVAYVRSVAPRLPARKRDRVLKVLEYLDKIVKGQKQYRNSFLAHVLRCIQGAGKLHKKSLRRLFRILITEESLSIETGLRDVLITDPLIGVLIQRDEHPQLQKSGRGGGTPR